MLSMTLVACILSGAVALALMTAPLHRQPYRRSFLLTAAGGTSDDNYVGGLRVQKVAVPSLGTLLNRDIFYYEVADWQWWDEVSERGEANPVTNPRAAAAAEARPTAPQGVYVVGSFTYGAKLWPACLAVAQVRYAYSD